MPCYKPLKAWRSKGGEITFKQNDGIGQSIPIKCNQCIGCRIDRSRDWAVRCVHEASLNRHNCFITLTYDDEHIPPDHGLKKSDFQKFMKRLRKHYSPKKIRFYMCGEYGDQLGRPHFHALLFNHDFMDKKKWSFRNKNTVYRSATLEKLWPYGLSEIGNVTFQSAAYVARYVMKKINGDPAKNHYEKVNTETGEIHKIEPEYNQMSLKPGIGHEWFKQFKWDVYPEDEIITSEGKRVATPDYYDKLLKKSDPMVHQIVLETRVALAKHERKTNNNSTPERLKVREICAKARLNQLKRQLT